MDRKYCRDKFVLVEDHLTNSWVSEASREIDEIRKKSGQKFEFSGHSKYTEIYPKDLLKTKVMELYNSEDFVHYLNRITGLQLSTTTFTGKTNVPNCKINCYDLKSCQDGIEWHYDRYFFTRGEEIVVVITLRNDLDDSINLEYFPSNSIVKHRVHLGPGSMTIHDPSSVIHRVLPVCSKEPGSWRYVVLLKYSTDPRPYNGTEYWYQKAAFYVKYFTGISYKVLANSAMHSIASFDVRRAIRN